MLIYARFSESRQNFIVWSTLPEWQWYLSLEIFECPIKKKNIYIRTVVIEHMDIQLYKHLL